LVTDIGINAFLGTHLYYHRQRSNILFYNQQLHDMYTFTTVPNAINSAAITLYLH